jgi:hypothetical protein
VTTGASAPAAATGAAGTTSASPAGTAQSPSSPPANAQPADATAGQPQTATAAGQPAGGPVPGGFAASSVTFVSAGEAFVLGTAPCAHAPCTSIVRTLNRGSSWVGLPAPVVPLGASQEGTSPAVWGIRFATPSRGFVFGTGLWATTDGGEHWARTASPSGRIVSLEVTDGQLLAVTQSCSASGGCGTSGQLMRRPLAGGAWTKVGPVTEPGPISTQAGVAAVLDGSRVLITTDGGLEMTARSTPCDNPGVNGAAAVAVTGQDSLALLCAGGAGAGSVAKTVYVSSDLGAHWAKAGTPASGGDPFGVAGGTPARLVVAADSGASWLYDSADGGREWGTAYENGDGGLGFNDLGFTTADDGVVVRAPAITDANGEHRPGQLLLTTNGGLTWQAVTW